MIRKALLQIGAPALLACMAWTAYLAVNHLRQMQHIAARTLESSTIRADISTAIAVQAAILANRLYVKIFSADCPDRRQVRESD